MGVIPGPTLFFVVALNRLLKKTRNFLRYVLGARCAILLDVVVNNKVITKNLLWPNIKATTNNKIVKTI